MSESLRVAIADDESDMRDYMERVLTRMGLRVIAVAENGRQLVDLCRMANPDLIVSDLRMTELDGDEAVRQLGGDPSIPFIAISAFPQPPDFGRELTAGRWYYLNKPIKRADLERAIRALFPESAEFTASVSRHASPLELPVAAAERPAESRLPQERGRAASTSDRRSLDLLLVDDDQELCDQLASYFSHCGHRVVCCHDGKAAWAAAQTTAFDVAIVDMVLPKFSGLDLLRKFKEGNCDCEVLMLTGQGTIELAVEAMKAGAFDFLTKPVRMRELETIVERAHGAAALRKENQQLRVVLKQQQLPHPIIGRSTSIGEVLRLIERVGPTDKPVLIQGESGTGKELVARGLHAASSLRDRPLVVINCAALPESLLESELFGHEKGAFTGAVQSKPGLFEVADGGTLFIDEIGELAGALQAKLLRVLEDGSLRRIGSVRERRVKVRLIAATNRDMAEEVQAGRFREDLYYRINVLTILVPPLRERAGDLPLLVEHFAGSEWQIAEEVWPTLSDYSWPGNVRQLANAIERAKILAEDEVIRLENLPPEIVRAATLPLGGKSEVPSVRDLASLTKHHVLQAYEQCNFNKARTARVLGVGRRSLYRLLERYGVHESRDPG